MIAYVTNIWTHYQDAICRELAKRIGEDRFRLVLTRPKDQRITSGDMHDKMGWELQPPDEPWIMRPPETEAEIPSGIWPELIRTAEVAIVGALHGNRSLFRAVDERVASGRLTFFMGERPFKNGIHIKDWLRPYNWYLWWRLHRRYNRTNVHFLAIGQGVMEDLRFLRTGKMRKWRWAYFPPVSEKPVAKKESDRLRICWCGRMIACKKVEYLIRAISLLPHKVRDKCEVTIVGEGEMRSEWIDLANRLNLNDVIVFKPLMSLGEVHSLMEKSDIYVFPSNGEEGWGVALEEAMDRCCVPIANVKAGATVLVEDGINGFSFKDGDVAWIADRIVWLSEHREEMRTMGVAAWRSVQCWSPRVGVERLFKLIDACMRGSCPNKVLQGLCANLK